MQLLILLILLAYGGKTEKLKEVGPLLESLGGEEMASALKSAQELGTVISAVQSAANGDGASLGDITGAFAQEGGSTPAVHKEAECGFPLEPIARIADEAITYSLSRYVATGA